MQQRANQPAQTAVAPGGSSAARPRQLISIRASLLTTLLGLVAAITLALLIGLAVSTVRLVRRMSGTIISACSSQVEAQLAAYFGPAETLLNTAASLAAAGLLDPADSAGMNRWLWPLCQHMPQIGSLRTCNAEGNCFALLRRNGEWLNAEVQPAKWPGQVHWTARNWPGGPPLRQWQEALPEDCRYAHWYTGALAADPGSVHWTEPYQFETTQDPGISASMNFQAPGRHSFVLAVDLLVSDLDDFTDSLRPTPFSYVVLTNSAGRLLESTTGTESQESPGEGQNASADPADARPPIENDRELMQCALSTWDKLQDRRSLGAGIPATGEESVLAASKQRETFRFYRADERWWGGLQPISLGGEAELMLAVLIPEADLLGEAQHQRNLLLIVALMS